MEQPVVNSPIETEEAEPDETPEHFTDRLTRLGSERGVNRQCSIGWHYECSDPEGEQCRCACHPERVARRAIPLPDEPGYYMGFEGRVFELDTGGAWRYGADDEVDPRDDSPLTRLVPEKALAQAEAKLRRIRASLAAYLEHRQSIEDLAVAVGVILGDPEEARP